MSLTYNPLATSDDCDENYQIGQDITTGQTIYYCDNELDATQNEEVVHRTIPKLVDEAVVDMKLVNLSTRKLLETEVDLAVKDAPNNRHQKKVYNYVRTALDSMESKVYYNPDGKIELVPRNIADQVDRLYIFGSSGAGKSTMAAKYALQYLKQYPGNRIFLFSQKSRDRVFDSIDGLIRVPFTRAFVTDHQGGDEALLNYQDSLVIFDDVIAVDDPDIRTSVQRFKNLCLSLGRAYGISTCSIIHKGLSGRESMVELCEASHLVGFPKFNLDEFKKLVQRYCGGDKSKISRIFDEAVCSCRWMCIIRPNIIVTEKFIRIIK